MSDLHLGSNVFCVVPLPAMRAFALQPRVAPALAALASAVGGVKGDLGDLDVTALGPAMAQFCAALPSTELEAVTRELLAGCTVDGLPLFGEAGAPGVFDHKMRGRTLDVWRLLWHAVKVNYPDFFALLAARRAGEAVDAPSAASST
jgi:hypothetical protein